MADDAHTEISAATVINGTPMVKWVNPVTTTYKPADWVYLTAAITATHLDADTEICNYVKPFQLEFKPRVSTTMARKDADDAYPATTDIIPMIMGSRTPAFITTVSKVTDIGGALYPGHAFRASVTAGDLTKLVNLTQSGSYIGKLMFIVNGFNTDVLESGDTYIKFCWT